MPRDLRLWLQPRPPDVEAALRAADAAAGYLHWADLRHRPTPGGLRAEDLWGLVKLQRNGAARALPLPAKAGVAFTLNPSDPMVAALHRIDTKEVLWKALQGGAEEAAADVSYRLMAAIEEAHHSSAIEGAVTTRSQSRELIRARREPVDRSERMVLDNFHAVEQLDRWVQRPLDVATICEIQATVTEGTLDDPDDGGRVRSDDDVRIRDVETGEVVFVPPPAEELDVRLQRLCAFANAEPTDDLFVHPIVRAILIHHQVAYDHPFADGNGRTARALFLWSVLKAGYLWFRSLSISRAVYRSRAKYYRSFLEVQTDEGDVTYFVRHQLACVEREIEHLARFLAHRASLERWLQEREAVATSLNRRQLALIDHALGRPDTVYTAAEHARFHGVSQPTAWKDLTGMVEAGLLGEERAGRKALYRPTGKLKGLIAQRPPRRAPVS